MSPKFPPPPPSQIHFLGSFSKDFRDWPFENGSEASFVREYNVFTRKSKTFSSCACCAHHIFDLFYQKNMGFNNAI